MPAEPTIVNNSNGLQDLLALIAEHTFVQGTEEFERNIRDPKRGGSFERCDVIICAMQIELGLKYEFCLPDSKAPGESISVTVKYGDTLEITYYAEKPPIR